MSLDFLENKYSLAIISILSGLYAAQIRPTLPTVVMDLFQNPIFRVLILFLVVVRSYKDPQFSLIIAVSFLLIMNIVNEQLFKDTFTNINIQENNVERLCSDINLNKKKIINCINNIDNYASDFEHKTKNLNKLQCMNVKTSNRLRDTCTNVQISQRDIPTNLDCVETYKLQPKYEIGTINNDCSNVF
jgi:hypothetical protein